MEISELSKIYQSVCEAPGGDGLNIVFMPDLFEQDPDNMIPHVHTFYEIIWFWDGEGKHTVDFQDYELEANSMFFLSPGQVHHFDGKTRHRGVTIKFCTNFLKDEQADEDIFIKYNVFNAFDSSPYCVIENTEIVEELKLIIQKMLDEHNNMRAFGHTDMLRSLVKIFLINVQRYGNRRGSLPLDSVKPSHRLFVMFRKLVETHFISMHTVKEYADNLNVSTKTLSNSVQECASKSPLTFINDRIILEAKRMLRYTDLMVKEIAFRLGYEDPSYFVKFYKRQTGYLPSEFREMVNLNSKKIISKDINFSEPGPCKE
ncbi:MAG: AraC family transcriptional regulator [Bacteroidaceae bacterium]|nr:AraC family transcriptional regulator [Bacteroidaceae bacterium]